MNTKLDAQFEKTRLDWQRAGDVPVRLYMKRSCAEGEIGKRYRALADELDTKLIIYTIDAQQYKAEDWDKVALPTPAKLGPKSEADIEKLREEWARSEGPITLHVTKAVSDGALGNRYRNLAKELRIPLTIVVTDEEDVRVTPEEKKALEEKLHPQQ